MDNFTDYLNEVTKAAFHDEFEKIAGPRWDRALTQVFKTSKYRYPAKQQIHASIPWQEILQASKNPIANIPPKRGNLVKFYRKAFGNKRPKELTRNLIHRV